MLTSPGLASIFSPSNFCSNLCSLKGLSANRVKDVENGRKATMAVDRGFSTSLRDWRGFGVAVGLTSWAMPREDGEGRHVRKEARVREAMGRYDAIMMDQRVRDSMQLHTRTDR